MSEYLPINDECVEEFKKMAKGGIYRYITYRVKADMKEIVIDNKAPKGDDCEADFRELKEVLKYAAERREPRYVACLAEIGKAFVMYWVPDSSGIKLKMVYSNNRHNLFHHLEAAIKIHIEESELDEITWTQVLDRVREADN